MMIRFRRGAIDLKWRGRWVLTLTPRFVVWYGNGWQQSRSLWRR